MRSNNRADDVMRQIRFTRSYTKHAEGSVLAEFGDTKVLCTASVENRVPAFLKGSGRGWVTAEYGMLPRATHTRVRREGTAVQRSGRTLEIQRLIGRSLRAVVNFEAIRDYTILLDCDVLQADGGTRTAAISGAYLALHDAVSDMCKRSLLSKNPLHGMVAAVSVGLYQGRCVLDLDYEEDSNAETDMNIVMNEALQFIEIQGTAEGHAFQQSELDKMLALAREGVKTILDVQRKALES